MPEVEVPTETETVELPEAELFDTLESLIAELYVNNEAGVWLGYDPEVKLEFTKRVTALFAGAGMFETAYNAKVWLGWEGGSLVEPDPDKDWGTDESAHYSTRKRRDPNAAKPGRKVQPKTAKERLFGKK